jgi:hypothetical protein
MLSQAYEPVALGVIENGSRYFRQWDGPAVLLTRQRSKLTKGATTTSTPRRSWATSLMGHSLPAYSAPASHNVRYAPEADLAGKKVER